MGFNNARAAMLLYSRPLRDRHTAFRVLMHMALISQDSDTERQAARVYFGGRDALAVEALGRDTETADIQAVKHALEQLRKIGAITLLAAGHRGKNSEYQLQLDVAEIEHTSSASAPVDNSRKGVTEPTPTAVRKGVTESTVRGSLSDHLGGHPMTPLQEDKKYKNSPYPLGDENDRHPVDNFEGGEEQNQDLNTAKTTPPTMATDYALRIEHQSTASAALVRTQGLSSRSGKHLAVPKSSAAPSARLDRRDQEALDVLMADGTDKALAQDMLDRAKSDPETKVPAARIKQPKYREELRSAVIRDRNHLHALASKAAGPCPHGELGGLVPTRAGKPTCATCRAEHNRQKESA